ncbi:MAG: hypothetical protein AB7S48_17115 [Bacteroidales bacterium]
MENTIIEKKESYKELSSLAFKLISVEKKNSLDVRNLLLQKGMSETDAKMLIDNIEFHIKSEIEKARRDMDKGFYIFSGGVIITGVTYLLADYMRFFVITWGFIAYGAFLMIRGFVNRK